MHEGAPTNVSCLLIIEDSLVERDLSEMHTSANRSGIKDGGSVGGVGIGSPFHTSMREYDGWMSACRNGDEVLLYSMNNARSRVLKNKIGLIELSRYVFARQMYLLFVLKKPLGCAEKGYNFIVNTRAFLERKYEQTAKDGMLDSMNEQRLNHNKLIFG